MPWKRAKTTELPKPAMTDQRHGGAGRQFDT
jgi:hypothetical protein